MATTDVESLRFFRSDIGDFAPLTLLLNHSHRFLAIVRRLRRV